MTQLETHKGVGYAVEGANPDLKAYKGVAYVFEGPPDALLSHKGVGYVVEAFDLSGNARQSVELEKPIYQSGAVPYVDFSEGTSLGVRALFEGEYTSFVYKPDQTFEEVRQTWVRGVNSLPQEDFNQMVVFRGKPARILLEALRVNMPERVVPTSLGVRPGSILLSGDMTDGNDQLALSGDMTDGNDVELQSAI